MDNKLLDEPGFLKAFHAAAASYIIGKSSGIKIQGSQEKIDATRNVMEASKKLYQTLSSPDAKLSEVSSLLESKHKASLNFRQITGINWLL